MLFLEKYFHLKTSVYVKTVLPGLIILLSSNALSQQRQMDVTQNPSYVFERSVSDIFPQLEQASATGENGRIGNEFVFWEYRLANNDHVYLFGCGIIDNEACEARIPQICPNTPTQELGRIMESGKVRHINCQPFSNARIGDIRPGCVQKERDHDLMAGLVQCPAQ